MTGAPAGYPALAQEPVAEPLFAVRNLHVDFLTADGPVRAVDGVDFTVDSGRTLGIVGESGSGKTVSTLAALGLLPGRTPIRVSGSAVFDGIDLLGLSGRARREHLGRDIGVIFQDPVSALDPVQRIGDQIVEALRLHDSRISRHAARARAVELLREVGVPDAAVRANAYPHQFSGGMCQRVVIAIAMANRPRLVIADEPTTAVDATVQAQLLELLARLQSEIGSAIVLITHDLALVSEVADRVCLMYAGRVVEFGNSDEFISSPHHPYGIGLLAGRSDERTSKGRLVMIPGTLPDPRAMPPGCRFEPRCFRGHGNPTCQAAEPGLAPDGSRLVACHFPGPAEPSSHEIGRLVSADLPAPTAAVVGTKASSVAASGGSAPPGPLLTVRGLVKEFPIRSSVLRRQIGRIRAVDGVDLDLERGETLGLVGESGCGKSTTGRLLLRLLEPTAGSVEVAGRDIASLDAAELRTARQTMQMVFQDPLGSLNPRLTAAENIADPLRAGGIGPAARRARIDELIAEVGLRPDHRSRLPLEFSGGQRQRIGIARALSVRPDFVVLDEPVASLDVSVQAQIINLLADLQERYRTGYVFISHDLAVVRHISDRTAVMYLGRVVEIGPTETLFASPAHPYTEALIAAAPMIGRGRRERIVLSGEPPSAATQITGCRFRGRCPRATQICAEVDPVLMPVNSPGQSAACHHPAVAPLSAVIR